MKIAFYAPLKSPCHQRPSGDRLVARLFRQAIADGGYEVELASEFRSWEGAGDPARQQTIRDTGLEIARQLQRKYATDDNRPLIWFTYHVYHKAPDWIGPAVSTSLNIPYVVAEASFAPKQNGGPWHIGQEQCRMGIHGADAVVSLNPQDDPCLRGVVKPSCELIELKPFMSLDGIHNAAADRHTVAQKWGLPVDAPWLICAAMMRPGDKLASYRQLADALSTLTEDNWHLIAIGDGAAGSEVSTLFEPFAPRVTRTGLLSQEEIYALFGCSDLYVWPAVNEAYGMALLEAQACGLPVASAAVGGVPQVVDHENTGLLAPANDPRALGRHVHRLLHDPVLRNEMGARAKEKCAREHDIRQATASLAGLFTRLTATVGQST